MAKEGEEIVWKVDVDGKRIGPVERRVAHGIDITRESRESWVIHEEVGLLVVSKDDGVSVLFQLRAKEKKVLPNTWSTGVAGHVEWEDGQENEPEASKSRKAAVMREADEEVGLRGVEMMYLGRYLDVGPKEARWKYMFMAEVPEKYPFVVDPDEVQKVSFFDEEKLGRAIAKGEKFYEPFVVLVRAFWSGN